MFVELHKAIIPAGFIRRANTYSLIRNDDGIFVILVGPAGSRVRTQGPIEQFVVHKVYEAIDKKVAFGEARLKEHGPEKCVLEKGSTFITNADILSAELSQDIYQRPKLSIKTPTKKYSFEFHTSSLEEVRDFMHSFLK